MKDTVNNAIKEKAKQNAERVRRETAIFSYNICPDCAGDLVEKKCNLFQKFFSSKHVYHCSRCGVDHDWYDSSDI